MEPTKLTNRVERERTSHNAGLERTTYDRILAHCGGVYERKSLEYISATFSRFNGRKFLEIGSSTWAHWFLGVVHPSQLDCINISEAELDRGRALQSASSCAPKFHLMDAHALSFDDNSFDVLFGSGILHHLDMKVALPEFYRVLRPGGIALFKEPLATNPVGYMVRKLTPKARTDDERPISFSDLRLFKKVFKTQLRHEQFLSVPAGVISGLTTRSPENAIMRSAYVVDTILEPIFGSFYRYVLAVGSK